MTWLHWFFRIFFCPVTGHEYYRAQIPHCVNCRRTPKSWSA